MYHLASHYVSIELPALSGPKVGIALSHCNISLKTLRLVAEAWEKSQQRRSIFYIQWFVFFIVCADLEPVWFVSERIQITRCFHVWKWGLELRSKGSDRPSRRAVEAGDQFFFFFNDFFITKLAFFFFSIRKVLFEILFQKGLILLFDGILLVGWYASIWISLSTLLINLRTMSGVDSWGSHCRGGIQSRRNIWRFAR